jgi:hypothetical protein
MTPSPAVLIITHNRFENVKMLLDKIIKSDDLRLYIAIDGPNKSDVKYKERVLEFKKHLDLIRLHQGVQIEVWERESNLGLACSMITAIDWFFAHEAKGIILEDDLSISNEFLNFANNALIHFEDHKEVLMISGNQFFTQENNLGDVSTCMYPLIWGWATWSDRWDNFRKTLNDGDILERKVPLKISTRFFLELGCYRSISCRNNSWAILFAAYSRFQGFQSVLPNVNLVTNLGNDIYATNTISKHWTLNREIADSYNPNFKPISKIDITDLVEKKIYGISNRHIFLFIKVFYLQVLIALDGSSNHLIDKLSNIKIPEID